VNRLSIGTAASRRRVGDVPKKSTWTPDDDNQLRTLLERGTSKNLVAAKLKRTVSSIEARVSIIKNTAQGDKLRLKGREDEFLEMDARRVVAEKNARVGVHERC
jgi:hypothetical protein